MSHSDKLQLFYQSYFFALDFFLQAEGPLEAELEASGDAMIWVTEAAEQNKEYHCQSKTVETVSHSSMSKKQIGETALLWFDYSLSQKCIYSRLVTILGFQT